MPRSPAAHPRLAALAAFLLVVGCAQPAPQPPLTAAVQPSAPPECTDRVGHTEEGTASWYGPGLDGRPTASGERFVRTAATAAHRTLPMGTEVKVTNLENGQETRLTINDRGPNRSGRILDVSEQAARDLGFRSDGTARVRVEAVEPC